ncbi:MAG: carboxylating nicotinate-nucleotide diphosphorylase [Candidatus Latescibacterota bacterium]|nr:MAG: carboxylating nicotinate-nucleotide diphosphorylase [Candidatus Latescibacterota bacterium]
MDHKEIQRLVDEALAEDGAWDDKTSAYLGIGDKGIRAKLQARASGVVAGLDVARVVFEERDPKTSFNAMVSDGDRVHSGDVVAEIAGRAAGVLSAERVALNFLQHLSGVATLTAQFVECVAGTGIRILDTRKTTPLLRRLEKYAVRVGGGENHRFNLSDMLLVKENHFRAIGGSRTLIALLKKKRPPGLIEVEVDSLTFFRELLGAPVDRIMLDNFSPKEVSEAVGALNEYRGSHPEYQPALEVSGGIDLTNARNYAIKGVDYISIGALTHSAPALDLSLEVVPDEP